MGTITRDYGCRVAPTGTTPGLTSTLGLQLVEQVSPGQVLEEVVVAVVHRAQVPGHRMGTCEPRAELSPHRTGPPKLDNFLWWMVPAPVKEL
jgi:hypothetical protein